MAEEGRAGDLVSRGQAAYERWAWSDAYALLSAADKAGRLRAEELDRLGMAAYLTGRVEPAVAAWERAHRAYLAGGETARGVRCAVWLGLSLVQRGDRARGGGWLARARRVLEDAALECAEQGYVRLPPALQALSAGDPETAYTGFEEVAGIAERFRDPDLIALARLGQGQARVAAGDAARGLALLDEAMVEVTSGEVSPIAAGIVYCAVILACRDIFDVRRAQEWTAVLSRWCARQPDLKPYRGQCLVHRSEIMQLRGEWTGAMEQARQACDHLSEPAGDPVLGMALYQQAELLRLRGELSAAEEAYRQASGWGHAVQPGLALLRLAQGRRADALAAIRRTLDEIDGPVPRSKVLAAYIEIALAAGDPDPAAAAADELAGIAERFDSAYLRAMVGYARGSLLLAGGQAGAAGAELRRSGTAWQELDAPYEAARVRLALARTCRALGDHDTADLELEAAQAVFEQLGAVPALAQVAELAGRPAPRPAGGLTAREVEVLRLVATGASNREIAQTLVISEKTVARHVANILTKLGAPSRTAAAAYAYRHDLV